MDQSIRSIPVEKSGASKKRSFEARRTSLSSGSEASAVAGEASTACEKVLSLLANEGAKKKDILVPLQLSTRQVMHKGKTFKIAFGTNY